MPDDMDLMEDHTATRPEAAIEMSELYAVIAALPDDFRDALVAIDLVGLSYREAARALRVKEATITTRLHRARQRVAQAVGPDPSLTAQREGRAQDAG
jgi:RNA polymerase sigma-70 factor, ECF subfamily